MPTEAAVVAVFYAMVGGMVIYREISLASLMVVLSRSVLFSAVIMFIIANAAVYPPDHSRRHA